MPDEKPMSHEKREEFLAQGINPSTVHEDGSPKPFVPPIDGIIDGPDGSKKKKKDDKPPREEIDMLNVANIVGLRVACERVVAKLREKWLVAKFRMENDVTQAAINKTALADHYWMEAHEARIRLDKAYEILSLMQDLEAEHRDELQRRRAGEIEKGNTGDQGTNSPQHNDGSKGGDNGTPSEGDRLVPRYPDKGPLPGADSNGGEAGEGSDKDQTTPAPETLK